MMLNNNIILTFPNFFLFRKSDFKDLKITEQKLFEENRLNNKKKDLIICSFCKNIITEHDKIIKIDGSHVHTFKNPSGIVYEIGCFSIAKGCFNFGDPTKDFTWFSGFSWTISICSNCHTHLGWYYKSNGSSFYGLILDRLTIN